MKISKQYLIKSFSGNQNIINKVNKYKDDFIVIEFMNEQVYKTRKQNNAFHGLLNCFHNSGCHSFLDYTDLRKHYKTIAGLIKIKKEVDLSPFTKKCLWEFIKIAPIEQKEKDKIILLLKGLCQFEESWSEVTKKKAKETLDILIKDMKESEIFQTSQGYEFEKILKDMGDFYEMDKIK